jgi:energy-coupling factor transporter ATP-binding protein EcfA2
MASVLAEYQRFLEVLSLRPVNEDVLRMANLVYSNLTNLERVGASRRARSSRLAPIAINTLAATNSDLPEFHNSDVDTQDVGRLHELKVGPFRGFTSEEIFDLSQSITLVYGANGTGKSSFCEALETALLGSINEAQVKRINHVTYCNNQRLDRHERPIVTLVSENLPPAILSPNEEKYRFCFIEKNRLDDFARIASRTPSDQKQLIATLFGIDQFSDFIRGFNPDIDEELNLTGQRKLELSVKRLALSSAEKIIQEYPQRNSQLDQDENSLADRIQSESNYVTICEWLLGTETQQGRLPYVQGLLESPSPTIYGVTSSNLTSLINEVFRINELWQVGKLELGRRSGEVSYRQLYEAVLQLSSLNPNECPACGTNLLAATQNPYQKATRGLEQLAELAELQRQVSEQSDSLQEAMRTLHSEMAQTIRSAAVLYPESPQLTGLPVLLPTPSGDWMQVWINDNYSAWNALGSICLAIEQSDEQARQILSQRQELVEERQKLDSYRSEIERTKLMRKTTEDQFNEAKITVANFDEVNRQLIELVAAEQPIMAYHNRVKHAYDGFLAEIKSYLNSLPAQLLQGLGEDARNLYNSFNRDDLPVDLLHELWLPLSENGKIELEFQGEPSVRYDALAILSEGHIKCLGLAILLAKNIAEDCPIVIFDDVVNAIDDEHRNGIWRTFFQEGLLDNKQVILTSHAEEFLHRIQQELGAERAGNIKSYKFLPHQGEHHLRVDTNPPTKNYVLRAQSSFVNDDKRDALYNSRAAIESSTDRLWTWMGRRGDGRIELKLSGPRSPWELNNKCTKIRSALKRLPNQTNGVIISINALGSLLGVNGGSIEWSYLNSGTHDSQRDGEFDRAAVNTIVLAVVSLDQALGELQRLKDRHSSIDNIPLPT